MKLIKHIEISLISFNDVEILRLSAPSADSGVNNVGLLVQSSFGKDGYLENCIDLYMVIN